MFKKVRDGIDDVLLSVELLVRVGESREVSAEIIAAFCACVVRRAKLSFLVSCSLCRSPRIDSGVGAEGGRGSVKFWRLVSGHNVFKVRNGKWPSRLYAIKEEKQTDKVGLNKRTGSEHSHLWPYLIMP